MNKNDAPSLDEIYGAPYGVDCVGPDMCGHYMVTVDGYKVPNLFAYKRKDTDTDWTIQLDGRFEYDMNDGELRCCIGLVANAMAIAAGYTHFGENSMPFNRYRTSVVGLSELPE